MNGAPYNTHFADYETKADQAWNRQQGFSSMDSRRTRSGSVHTFNPMTNTTTRYHYHENKGTGNYVSYVKGSFDHSTGKAYGDWSNVNQGRKAYK